MTVESSILFVALGKQNRANNYLIGDKEEI